MILIDSNIIIYSAFPQYSYLRPLVMDSNNFVSAISKVEVLGFHNLTQAEQTYFESIFQVLQIIPLDDPILEQAIEFRKKQKMKLGDAIIGASAYLFNLELYTRNTADFKHISNLAVKNPVK